MDTKIGQRIKERRESLGISAEALGEKVGKAKTTIYRYEQGFIEKMPTSVLADIAKALHTSPLYLLGMTDDVSPLQNTLPQNAFPLTPYGRIPIVAGIAAGNPVDMEQGDYDWGFADAEYCDGNHFMLRVEGNSMEPTVPNGSTAIILKQDYAERGQIVAFEMEGYATLKRYYPQPNGTILLQADNPAAESYVITKEQLMNGQARILGVLREYKKKF